MKQYAIPLLLLPGLLRAGVAPKDRPCDMRLKDRAKAGWLHELPKPESMPPVEQVRPVGAWIILDEIAQFPKGCFYTQIAYIADEEAARRFSDYVVRGNPVIKGRVRHPDGRVEELEDGALACGERRDYSLLRFGPASDPYRMLVHFPRIEPGSLVQIQLIGGYCAYGQSDRLTDVIFKGIRGSHTFINLWRGAGEQLTLGDGQEARNYPTELVRYNVLRLKGQKLEWKTYPAETMLRTQELSGLFPDHDLLQFTVRRPFLKNENYAPRFLNRSPLLVITRRNPSFDDTGWDALANVLSAYGMDKRADAAARLKEINPIKASVNTPEEIAKHHARFFRDHPESWHYEFGTLQGVLKSQGFKLHKVLVRAAGRRPIDRGVPSLNWFDHELYAVDVESGRLWLDPESPIPAGRIPAAYQGGEALVVGDRKQWEWMTLPVSGAGDNQASMDVRLVAREEAAVRGSVELTLTGSQAEHVRWMRNAQPADLDAGVLALLRRGTTGEVVFAEPTVSGLSDFEAPVIIRANFTLSGGVIKLGASERLKPQFWRDGPTFEDFIEENRSADIEFGLPTTLRSTLRFPLAWSDGEARLPDRSISAPGLSYTLSQREEAGQAVVERVLITGGLQPQSAYPRIREFTKQLAEFDSYLLAIRPESDSPAVARK